METVLLPAGTHSRTIVIKSNFYPDKGYSFYNKDNLVLLGEQNVSSPLVKIEVERAKVDERYVHFKFSQSNNYWAQRQNGRSIVAESDKPEEDTTKSGCTLFEPVSVEGRNGLFYLIHVHSGGRLLFDNATMIYYVQSNPHPTAGYLIFEDWKDN